MLVCLPSCSALARSYNAVMLDIKLIREQPEWVRERLASRGAGDESKLAELLAIDGWYTTAEEMEGVSRGKAVQAFLDNDALCVVPLG